jgi:hypothetical protein
LSQFSIQLTTPLLRTVLKKLVAGLVLLKPKVMLSLTSSSLMIRNKSSLVQPSAVLDPSNPNLCARPNPAFSPPTSSETSNSSPSSGDGESPSTPILFSALDLSDLDIDSPDLKLPHDLPSASRVDSSIGSAVVVVVVVVDGCCVPGAEVPYGSWNRREQNCRH